jgi:hypothetical protein
MNGGAKGKLSGKIRCSRTLWTLNSSMSCANGDSGSRWKSRTCHSNKLSLINSACVVWMSGENKQNNCGVENERNLIFMQIWAHKFASLNLRRRFFRFDRSATFAVLGTLSSVAWLGLLYRFWGRLEVSIGCCCSGQLCYCN